MGAEKQCKPQTEPSPNADMCSVRKSHIPKRKKMKRYFADLLVPSDFNSRNFVSASYYSPILLGRFHCSIGNRAFLRCPYR